MNNCFLTSPFNTDCTKELADNSLANLDELLNAVLINASFHKCLKEEPGQFPGSSS